MMSVESFYLFFGWTRYLAYLAGSGSGRYRRTVERGRSVEDYKVQLGSD